MGESAVWQERVHTKPSAFIGTSPGKIGTAIAQQHLRSILTFCNSPQMNSIEAYIQFERGLIDDDGQVNNESTREFLQNYRRSSTASSREFIRCCRERLKPSDRD
jgi:NAD(P)H-dependent FMN reductase